MPPRHESATTAPSLRDLAELRFGPLSLAEIEIFRALQEGRAASMLTPNARENNPARSDKWSAARVVRAECLAWVCTDSTAKSLVHYRGIDIRGMKIKGELDLSKAKVDLFVSAERCVFLGSVLLRYTEGREFHFIHCQIENLTGDRNVKALDAEGAKISGSLYFKDGTDADGEVSLLGVTLGGDLDCHGAVFSNPGGDALSADGIKVEGDVLLTNCSAQGGVRFIGATIKGDLDCGGARLKQFGSLDADGIKIEGDALLAEGFCADGSVSFAEAQILGNLDCTGGHFLSGGDALRLEGTDVKGNVLLNSFKADGEVNLRGATVGGSLECKNAQFLHSEDALTADALEVAGDLILGEQFLAQGEVRMFRAIIKGDLDCKDARFLHAEGALSADGAKISGDVKLSDGIRADGQIRFPGATIGGDFDCEQTELLGIKTSKKDEGDSDEDSESTLDVEGARIEGSVFFGKGVVVEGEVSLIGTVIAGDLDFGSATFRGVNGTALSANRANIGGDVLFGNGFSGKGKVSFLGALIGGDLECNQADFSNGKNDALSAESAKIEGSVTLGKLLKLEGSLSLQNVEVRNRLNLSEFAIPEKATINLRSATIGAIHGHKVNLQSAGHLKLDGFTYGRFHIDDPKDAASWILWLQKQPRGQFAPQPFEQLAVVLRRMGYEHDARRVMIAKNHERAGTKRFLGQGWWWYNVFGRLIGYGYAPWRAFALSIVMIAIGFFLFSSGYDSGVIIPTKETAYKKNTGAVLAKHDLNDREPSELYPVFSPLIYSVESFTPLLKLDQSANWAPDANRTTGRFLRYYLYAHIAFGWLLTSLWVGAITGLVKS